MMRSGRRRLAVSVPLAVVLASGAAAACAARSESGTAGHQSGAGAPGSGVATVPAVPASSTLPVTPAVGSPKTRFQVSFIAPANSGVSGGVSRAYVASATGPHGSHGCAAAVQVAAGAARAGQTVTVTMTPGGHRSQWCLGKFTGRVEQETRPVCHPGTLCPQFIAVRPIGHFRFTVRAAR